MTKYQSIKVVNEPHKIICPYCHKEVEVTVQHEIRTILQKQRKKKK